MRNFKSSIKVSDQEVPDISESVEKVEPKDSAEVEKVKTKRRLFLIASMLRKIGIDTNRL